VRVLWNQDVRSRQVGRRRGRRSIRARRRRARGRVQATNHGRRL